MNVRAGVIATSILGLWWLIGRIIRIRNRIVATRQQVRSGNGLIDIALVKRAELVPNLVAVIEAATVYTDSVIGQLTELRTLTTTGDALAQQLRLLTQAHPQLKSSEHFSQLQDALFDVENELAVARGFVVDAEAVHQTRIQAFPDSLVAAMFRLR